MANPKRRHSKSRRNKRKANWKAEMPSIITCPNCKKPKPPHVICPSCGFYNNELIKPPKVKKKKEEQSRAA